MLALLDRDTQPISQAPSFEAPGGQWPAPWSRWIKWGAGTMTASPDAARTGQQGVLCRNVKRGGPHQTLTVRPGRYAAVASVRVPARSRSPVRMTLSLTPLDEQGRNRAALAATSLVRPGDWQRLVVAGAITVSKEQGDAVKVRLIAYIDGQEAVDELHIDDLAMYRIE
jgi:hypothetical protein